MKQTNQSIIPWAKEIDISMEVYREYTFPGNEKIRIDAPKTLVVSDNGHRVGAADGSHYIPYGWIHLYWLNKPSRILGGKPYQFYYQRQIKENKKNPSKA